MKGQIQSTNYTSLTIHKLLHTTHFLCWVVSAILGYQLSFADLSCPHVGRDFCSNRDCAVAG